MAKKLIRLREKSITKSTAFKWETDGDIGVIHTKKQIVSAWLDPLGINMSIALFLQDIEGIVYPITTQTISDQDTDFYTPLSQWVEDYNIKTAMVSPIFGAPDEVNKEKKRHPICKQIRDRFRIWDIRIAEPWVPFTSLSELNSLKREEKLNFEFFETQEKVEEFLKQSYAESKRANEHSIKHLDGRLMAYLQYFSPYVSPAARLMAMYG